MEAVPDDTLQQVHVLKVRPITEFRSSATLDAEFLLVGRTKSPQPKQTLPTQT